MVLEAVKIILVAYVSDFDVFLEGRERYDRCTIPSVEQTLLIVNY